MAEITLEQVYGDGANRAASILQNYDQWLAGRADIEEEWQKTQNMIFATDAAQSVGICASSTWRNNSTRGKIAQIRDNLHANYFSALMGTQNWLKWESTGNTEDLANKRKIITAYMRNKTNLGGFEKIISDALYDYIDYGVAFVAPIWVNDVVEYTDPETGVKIPIVQFKGCKAIRYSPHDVVINPTASDIKDTPVFIRSLVTFGQIAEMADSRPADKEFSNGLEKLRLARQAGGSGNSSAYKDKNYSMQGFSSFSSYLSSGNVELITFMGSYTDDSGKLHKNKKVVIADRNIILEETDMLPMPSSRYIHMAGWRDRPDNLYSQSPLAKLLGLQFRIDKLENLKADAMDLVVEPPLMIKGDVDSFTWQPGEVIGADVDGSVTEISKNLHNIALAQNEIHSLEQTMEELAGAPKQAMGFRTPGEKTAFEVQTLETAGSRIFQQKIEKFEKELIEPLLNDMLNLARAYGASRESISIIDPDLNVEDFIEVTKEDLITSGSLRAVGSRHFLSKAKLVSELTQLMNTNAFQIIQPHVSAKNLAMLYEDILEIDKYDIIRPYAGLDEQAEMQQYQMQLEQELAMSDSVDTDMSEGELYAAAQGADQGSQAPGGGIAEATGLPK